MSEPKNLHTNVNLTNFSLQYRNDEFIWRSILPVVKVGKVSDNYLVRPQSEAFKIANDQIGPNGLPNEVGVEYSSDKYKCVGHALADYIAQEDIDSADAPVELELDVTENISDVLELNQEHRVAMLVQDPNTYPAGNKVQLSGTAQWGGTADDPIEDVKAAIRSCFQRANTLVFGHDAWEKFRGSSKIIAAVQPLRKLIGGDTAGQANRAEVAAFFEVDKVLVGRARYNSAVIGQTSNLVRLWGKHMMALHVKEEVRTRTITFGKTFSELEKRTYQSFDGRRGTKGSHYYKVAWNSDEKIVASDLGYLIQDAVA